MFTQCPQCDTYYRLDVGELKIGHGRIKCTRCGEDFNAIETLGDTINSTGIDEYAAIPELDESQVVYNYSVDQPEIDLDESVTWFDQSPVKPLKERLLWSFSSFGLLLLLAFQTVLVNKETLLETPVIRNYLIDSCNFLNCRLPDYHNIAGIDVVDHTLFQESDDFLRFQLVISNNAEFKQPLPPIQLTLMTFTGDTMARRVFNPGEYSSDYAIKSLMPKKQPVELTLKIAKPAKEIGGYQFKLMES